MMGRLQAAVRMADERKAAALGIFLEDVDLGGEPPVGFADQEVSAHLFLGWELDPHELMTIPHDIAWGMLKAQAGRATLPSILSGTWVDGLLTGLLLSQIKEDS